jgi:hypothetical protein
MQAEAEGEIMNLWKKGQASVQHLCRHRNPARKRKLLVRLNRQEQ